MVGTVNSKEETLKNFFQITPNNWASDRPPPPRSFVNPQILILKLRNIEKVASTNWSMEEKEKLDFSEGISRSHTKTHKNSLKKDDIFGPTLTTRMIMGHGFQVWTVFLAHFLSFGSAFLLTTKNISGPMT